MEKLAMSVNEAADVLGVSASTIYQLVRRGDLAKLPHLRKSVRIARIELERFAAQGVKDVA
jgi:excisionase family DNA binding protein